MVISGSRLQRFDALTEALLAFVPPDAFTDLQTEDSSAAIDAYFGPVGFQTLPSNRIVSADCSTDGYYDPWIDPERPWIIYADDVDPVRVRFTILHELGHHLFATIACELLDGKDKIGGDSEEASHVEEVLCHRFASHLLIPDAQARQLCRRSGIFPTFDH